MAWIISWVQMQMSWFHGQLSVFPWGQGEFPGCLEASSEGQIVLHTDGPLITSIMLVEKDKDKHMVLT